MTSVQNIASSWSWTNWKWWRQRGKATRVETMWSTTASTHCDIVATHPSTEPDDPFAQPRVLFLHERKGREGWRQFRKWKKRAMIASKETKERDDNEPSLLPVLHRPTIWAGCDSTRAIFFSFFLFFFFSSCSSDRTKALAWVEKASFKWISFARVVISKLHRINGRKEFNLEYIFMWKRNELTYAFEI